MKLLPNACVYMMVTFLEDGMGGVEMLVMRTARKLAALGERVSIVTCFFFDKAEKGERFCFKKSADNITIYRIPALHGFTILNAFLFFAGSFIVFLPAFRKKVVLHAFQVNSSGVIACLLKKIFKLKVIVQDICGGSFGDVAELKRMPFSGTCIKCLKDADAYISPSTQISEELISIGFLPDKIRSIEHGVDINVFKPSSNEDEGRLNREKLSLSGTKNVIFVGRLAPQKRPLFLLKAWEIVIKEYPNTRLLIFGKGELEDELKEFCRNRGLESSVEFKGVIKDLVPYYRSADIFVLPSHAEGVSIALLEAMSCGMAVVVSDIPGNAQVIQNGKNGLLFEMEDVNDCVRKITVLLSDEQLSQRLGNEARNTIIEKYSSDAMTKTFVSIYQELL